MLNQNHLGKSAQSNNARADGIARSSLARLIQRNRCSWNGLKMPSCPARSRGRRPGQATPVYNTRQEQRSRKPSPDLTSVSRKRCILGSGAHPSKTQQAPGRAA